MGGPVEAYEEATLLESLEISDSQVFEAFGGRDHGLALRLRSGSGGRVVTNILRPSDGLDHEIARLAVAAGLEPDIGLPDSSVRPAGPKLRRSAVRHLRDHLRVLDETSRSYSKSVVDVHARATYFAKEVSVRTTDGLSKDELRERLTIVVQVVAEASGLRAIGYESLGLSGEQVDPAVLRELATRAAEHAEESLHAIDFPAGRVPVVLCAGAGGLFVHEACGHPLEADSMTDRRSIFHDKVGTQVAPEEVSIVDDPTVRNGFGSYAFDDEGTDAARTLLVDKGRLESGLRTRLTSASTGVPSTGNARRASYEHDPIPRMSNVMMLPGSVDPEELIASLDRGVLVKSLLQGQADAISGDFTFTSQSAFAVEKGRATHPVRPLRLSGNSLQALNDIRGVAKDFSTVQSLCVKRGQHVPVSGGSPTILIGSLEVN